jgi:hypothetical protein
MPNWLKPLAMVEGVQPRAGRSIGPGLSYGNGRGGWVLHRRGLNATSSRWRSTHSCWEDVGDESPTYRPVALFKAPASRARKCIPQGLNRLRKKALVAANISKSKPQGLKPALILWHLRHATQRVPRSCPDTSCRIRGVFPQPVKPTHIFAQFAARLNSLALRGG